MLKLFSNWILVLLFLASQSVWASNELRKAAEAGNVEEVTSLLKAGHNADDVDRDVWTALHYAASAGHTPVVQVLINEGKANVNAKTNKDITPLHVAARWGYSEAAKILIDAKADLDAKDQDDDTPLHRAAWADRLETAQLLVSSGADPAIINKGGKTPLEVAVRRGHLAVANYLREWEHKKSLGFTPLHFAAWGGNLERVKSFVASGADPGVTTSEGKTPLQEV